MGFKERPKRVKLPSWCGNPKHTHEPHINNGDCDPPKPRKGSIRYEIQRLAPSTTLIMQLADTAVDSKVSFKEITYLLRAAYRGAVKRKTAEAKCEKDGHVWENSSRCKRCGAKIDEVTNDLILELRTGGLSRKRK